jgi:bla regulator protein blaR1
MNTPALLLAAVAAASVGASAQQADRGGKLLAFDAASVKPNKSGDWRKSLGPAPGGRFLATNNTLRDLIPFAYGIPQVTAAFRIVGGPKWIDEDRFDVTATVDGTWTPQQMSEMLRTLLVDRFKLAAHHETRDLPIYTLVAASGGARLRRSEIDQAACEARRAAIQRREPVPPIPAGAPPVCGIGRSNPGTITAVGWSMDALTSALSPFVSRVVLDRSGLSGLFDFELKWTPDTIPQQPPDAPPLNIDPNGPSIFTALQEQLGLRLESARGPVDVVVIDRVEHPTPD